MSDEPRKPDPFENMNVDDVGVDIPLEFPMDPHVAEIIASTPNPKANGKRRWWEKKEKTEKPRTPRARKPMPTMPTGGLKTPITNIYIGIGMGLMPFNATVAKAVVDSAEGCAEAWVEYAKTNPAVKRFLIQLCAASAMGTLMAAHLPILMAVVASTPAFQKKQGAMLAEMAERFANGNIPETEGEN